MNFNVKLAKRDIVPLSHWEITSDLVAVVMQPSRVASSSIRAGERETVMEKRCFIIWGWFTMTVRIGLHGFCDFMMNIFLHTKGILVFCLGCLIANPLWSGELSRTIESIKPSIVGIGTYQKTRSPPVNFVGTGFAVGDGLSVITNAHVIPNVMDTENKESLGIITGKGDATEFRAAVLVAIDKEHDLAHLKISGTSLPAVKLGDSGKVLEGQLFAFTGFPIGMILGFHHVTHRGMISSITPVAMPALNSRQLDVKKLVQLQKSAYTVFQLDGTAYPGSSGSPLYDPETGIVYGIINMVFVKGLKEAALSQPSGITYAIPGNYIRDLLQRK